MATMDDVLAIGGIIAGIIGAGGGTLGHRKARKVKEESDELNRITREQVLKLEERVDGMGKAFDKNMEDMKDDLRYIRESLDKLREKK